MTPVTTSIHTARGAALAVAVLIADQVTKALAERAHPGPTLQP